LEYCTNKDLLIGLEDYGDGEKTNFLATSATVFMARGICGNWKQPLAYFLVNEACSSDKVKEKLFQIIDKVEQIGLSVLAIVCDIGSNFKKLFRELNLSYENPSFVHKGKKIVFLFDPPHIIKAVRNNLMKYNFHFGDGKFASWKDIKQLYEIDSKNDIRCCPKLTQSHLFPNNFQKMKVKLATQVLSHTVSSAICTAVSTGQLPSRAAATAEFVETFDQIFDSLNSSSPESPKRLNKPITQDSGHCEFMKEMSSFVKNIKVIDPSNGKDVTNSLKCLDALQATLNGTVLLWKSLQDESVTSLCTKRLNQDPLENHFGEIRQQGGNSDAPTPIQFARSFRTVFYQTYLSPSNGNCAQDFDSILATVGTNYQNFVDDSADIIEGDETPEFSNIIEGDYQQLLEEKNIINKNAITYVTGYLAKKCLQKHPCETCTNALTNNVLDSPDKLFTYFKSFDETDSTFGKLTVPADDLIKYITGIDAKLVETFEGIMTINGIGKYLVSNLPKFYLQECSHFPSEYLLKLFVKMRIHYILKFGNRQLLIPQKNGKKNRKYFKVTHL